MSRITLLTIGILSLGMGLSAHPQAQARSAVTKPLEELDLTLELTGVELSKTSEGIRLELSQGYCDLRQLESPRGEILAFGTEAVLGNGLNVRYDLDVEADRLEGLLYSRSALYRISGYNTGDDSQPHAAAHRVKRKTKQTSKANADGHFCLDVFSRLEPREGTTF